MLFVKSNYLGPSDEIITMLVPDQDYRFDEEEKANSLSTPVAFLERSAWVAAT